MTTRHPAMDRAFEAMHQFAVGNEALVHELARCDPEAVAFIQGLHPDFPIDWVRDPWPAEVVDARRQLPGGQAFFSCTVGEIQASIRAVLAGEAARAAAIEAMFPAKRP